MYFDINSKNPLFEGAKTAVRKPHFVVAIFLSLFFIICGALFGEIASQFLHEFVKIQDTTWRLTFNQFSENILLFAPIILIVYLWIKFYEKRSFSSLGFFPNQATSKIVSGLLIGAAMFSLIIIALYFTNNLAWQNGSIQTQGLQLFFPILLIFFSFLVQGSTEEIVIRGWLMPNIATTQKPWIAISISAAVFALLHGLNSNITVLAVFNLVLFGYFIAIFALKQGSLIGACVWHGIWNWLQGNVYGLEVSGNKNGLTLFNFIETGPDWLTGGKFGPEGGLAATIILIFASLIALNLKNKPNLQTI